TRRSADLCSHRAVHLEPSAPLAPHCTLGIGGPAQYLATARTESEVGDAVRWARERQLPLRVLGGGSNLVVGDEGVAGVVLRPELKKNGRAAFRVRMSTQETR